jgi:tetratricopeptide (TPR) repeat protein
MKSNIECAIKFDTCKIDISILFVFILYAVFNLLLFPTILAQNSTSIYDLYNEGAAQDSSGNYTQAIQFYDKALAINPNYTNAQTYKEIAINELDNQTLSVHY